MKNYLPKSELVNRVEVMSQEEAIARGESLREEGYRINHHPIWGSSVAIPSGEQLSDVQIAVRHGDGSMDDSIFKKAFEYLILYKEKLSKISGGVGFSLS